MLVCTTQRLRLRWATAADAAFMMELVNDPDWLRFIGDRDIHDLDAARTFIAERFMARYENEGYGLNIVELKETGEPIGIAGFLKRDGLDGPDVGFALMPAFRGQGYAYEASSASLRVAREEFGIEHMLGITNPENHASRGLLERLGLSYQGLVTLPGDDEELALFGGALPPPNNAT